MTSNQACLFKVGPPTEMFIEHVPLYMLQKFFKHCKYLSREKTHHARLLKLFESPV